MLDVLGIVFGLALIPLAFYMMYHREYERDLLVIERHRAENRDCTCRYCAEPLTFKQWLGGRKA